MAPKEGKAMHFDDQMTSDQNPCGPSGLDAESSNTQGGELPSPSHNDQTPDQPLPASSADQAREPLPEQPLPLAKSLEGCPREAPNSAVEEQRKKKGRRIRSRVSGVLFYAALIAVVAIVFVLNGGGSAGGKPRSFFGYSAFRVLSNSMQSEIPQDALVVTKAVTNPESLLPGDNITFVQADGTTCTHKIITVYKQYGADGLTAFQTQGVENNMPDEEVVFAPNIVGKVVFHSARIGKIFLFVKEHVLFIGLFSALSIGLILSLGVFFKAGKAHKAQAAQDAQPPTLV